MYLSDLRWSDLLAGREENSFAKEEDDNERIYETIQRQRDSVNVHFTFTLILIWAAYRWGVQAGAGGDRRAVRRRGHTAPLCLRHPARVGLQPHCYALRGDGARYHLLPIGGLAQMEEMPAKPAQELKMALAGPLTNIAIAVLLILICLPLGSVPRWGLGSSSRCWAR